MKPRKTESLEAFLARGGEVKKLSSKIVLKDPTKKPADPRAFARSAVSRLHRSFKLNK
jgi:hypothetical protein